MDNVVAIDEQQDQPKEKTPAEWHKFWTKEMEASEKRLRKFSKQGNQITRKYLDKRDGTELTTSNATNQPYRLNIFHSNIKTLQSMLFGNVPKIEVGREHHDPDDDVARVASMLFQRLLEADVEPSGSDLPTILKAALQDRLIPGIGFARVRYSFETASMPSMNPETMQVEEVEQVIDEQAPIDYIHWQDLRWGWCRTWNEMPWLGMRSWLTKAEATKRFGAKQADGLEYKNQQPTGSEKSDMESDRDQQNNIQKAEVWEIWFKKDKKVFWWSPGADLILDAVDDPLELDGFWPGPRPMAANLSTTQFIPVADYILAQDLYQQVDELYTRISIITRAIKVVGVYDKNATDSVGRMLKEGIENDLIPVDNWAMFAEKGGLQGTIQWFPVQEVVGTLQVLRQVLGETIEMLNNITGMSEIMKGGAGGQYTAAASNQMAAKMGSITVQALQDDFARFASELEGLKAEVVAKHFDPQSIAKQTNAMWIPQPDREYLPQALQLIKSPDIKWRVNIRPESIAMIDYAQLKSERTEFLTAMATFLQSAQATVKAVPGSTPIMLEFMKWGMAGFKGANYLEGIMDQFIEKANEAAAQEAANPNKEPNPEETKMQIEQIKQQGAQQKAQAELQKIQAKSAADMQTLQVKLQGEIQKIQVDAQRDMTIEQQQQQNKLEEIAKSLQADIAEIQASMQSSLSVEEAQATFDIALEQERHANNMAEIYAQNRNRNDAT